jgi:hypothetical protein
MPQVLLTMIIQINCQKKVSAVTISDNYSNNSLIRRFFATQLMFNFGCINISVTGTILYVWPFWKYSINGKWNLLCDNEIYWRLLNSDLWRNKFQWAAQIPSWRNIFLSTSNHRMPDLMKETVTQDDDVWKNQSFMVTDSVLIKSQNISYFN